MWVLILPLYLCLNGDPCDPQIVQVAHYETKALCEAEREHQPDTYCVPKDILDAALR